MISVSEADKRIGVASLPEDQAFRMLCDHFDTQLDRLVAKMMDNKTSDKDTIILKGVINEMRRLSPMALQHGLLAQIEAKLAKSGTGQVVFTKKKG